LQIGFGDVSLAPSGSNMCPDFSFANASTKYEKLSKSVEKNTQKISKSFPEFWAIAK